MPFCVLKFEVDRLTHDRVTNGRSSSSHRLVAIIIVSSLRGSSLRLPPEHNKVRDLKRSALMCNTSGYLWFKFQPNRPKSVRLAQVLLHNDKFCLPLITIDWTSRDRLLLDRAPTDRLQILTQKMGYMELT